MSPTVFRWKGLRFSFYSGEEDRMHVHVYKDANEAKIWLEPEIEVEFNDGLRSKDMANALQRVREKRDEIEAAWKRHFGS